MQPTSDRLQLPLPEIAAICQRMGVARLAMFGSSLRDDFGPQSDVDVLVHFAGDDAGPWAGCSGLGRAVCRVLLRYMPLIGVCLGARR